MVDKYNPFQVEFSLLKDLEVQKDASNNSYIVIATFKKPEYFNEDVLKEQNLVYNVSNNKKKVTVLNWKEGLQLFRSWLAYLNNTSKNNIYNAKINLIISQNNEEDHNEVVVKNIVLSNELNKALNDIAAILAMDDPIYYKDKRNKIDMSKVFNFLIITALQNFINSSDLTMASTIGQAIGKRVASTLQTDANANLQAIKARDEKLVRNWNYSYVLANQNMLIWNLLLSDSNFPISSVTRQKLKQILNNPFPNGQDSDHLFTGSEEVRSYVDGLYNDLNNIDPASMNIQLEQAQDVEDSYSYSSNPSSNHSVTHQIVQDEYGEVDISQPTQSANYTENNNTNDANANNSQNNSNYTAPASKWDDSDEQDEDDDYDYDYDLDDEDENENDDDLEQDDDDGYYDDEDDGSPY